MSRFGILPATVLSLLVLTVLPRYLQAQSPASSSDSSEHLAIVFGGPIDSQLVSKVTEFIDKELTVNLLVKPPLSDLKDGFDALAKELASSVDTSTEVCLLAVVAAPWNLKQQGAVYKPLHVGIVNISALAVTSDDKVPFSKKEQFERRVEKEALRAIALLCGLKPCPFPRCCLYEHRNEKELDQKALNFCPPCHSKAINALRKASIPAADKDVSGSK